MPIDESSIAYAIAASAQPAAVAIRNFTIGEARGNVKS
jgi:hypothetical protein